MASGGQEEKLNLSVRLNLYTDPGATRCGHNVCRVCIDLVLKAQGDSSRCTCPKCNAQCLEWPGLQRNVTPCNVMENFLSPHQEDITGICCSYCIHSPVPAVRSCLHCEASLCEDHLRVHNKSPEHVLTDPSTSLEKRKCPVHKKILEYYCTEDRACICVSCRLDGEHQGHLVETLEEVSEMKKEKLRKVLRRMYTKRQKTDEKIQKLEERRGRAQEKADNEAERVNSLFIDLRRRLDELEKKLHCEISRQEEQESLSLSDLIQKLDIKKDELSRKIRRMEDHCNMTDPLSVLQEPDAGDLCDSEEDTGDLYDPAEEGGDDEDIGGHNRSDHGAQLISNTFYTLSEIIRSINVTFYGQRPADVLLDVDTAANNILISEDLKTATRTEKKQRRPETAERFQYFQVMSRNSFSSGRHYWDVEISALGICWLGMCYPSIDRRGSHSYIGGNNKSWCLFIGRGYISQCSVRHDGEEIRLPQQISSDRVRIYVDYEAGELSFYELCDPIRHIHTFAATFTEPLHAALCVWNNWIKMSGGAGPQRKKSSKNPVTSQRAESDWWSLQPIGCSTGRG